MLPMEKFDKSDAGYQVDSKSTVRRRYRYIDGTVQTYVDVRKKNVVHLLAIYSAS